MNEQTGIYVWAIPAVAAFLVLFETWRGWRLGVVRQVFKLLALGVALLVGYFTASVAVPVLRPLGLPDGLLAVLGGCAIGLVFYLCAVGISAVIFKKTSQQSVGVIRWGFGGLGALVGALWGLVLVAVLSAGLRMMGTVAETQLPAKAAHDRHSKSAAAENEAAREFFGALAGLKKMLDAGITGAVLGFIDPVPARVYSNLEKLGKTLSSERYLARLLEYPGTKVFADNPRFQALGRDPEVARALLAKDYFSLVRNPHVIEAFNDPEITRLFHEFELEKALDYALSTPENRERSERGPPHSL